MTHPHLQPSPEQEKGRELFRQWCGNSYEWDALTNLEQERWNRLAADFAKEKAELESQSKQANDVALQMTMRLHEVADERDTLRSANAEMEEKAEQLQQLLFEVETKWPNESRFETALRYIRERETRPVESACEPKINPAP